MYCDAFNSLFIEYYYYSYCLQLYILGSVLLRSDGRGRKWTKSTSSVSNGERTFCKLIISVRENSLYGVLLLLPMESTTPYME